MNSSDYKLVIHNTNNAVCIMLMGQFISTNFPSIANCQDSIITKLIYLTKKIIIRNEMSIKELSSCYFFLFLFL